MGLSLSISADQLTATLKGEAHSFSIEKIPESRDESLQYLGAAIQAARLECFTMPPSVPIRSPRHDCIWCGQKYSVPCMWCVKCWAYLIDMGWNTLHEDAFWSTIARDDYLKIAALRDQAMAVTNSRMQGGEYKGQAVHVERKSGGVAMSFDMGDGNDNRSRSLRALHGI